MENQFSLQHGVAASSQLRLSQGCGFTQAGYGEFWYIEWTFQAVGRRDACTLLITEAWQTRCCCFLFWRLVCWQAARASCIWRLWVPPLCLCHGGEDARVGEAVACACAPSGTRGVRKVTLSDHCAPNRLCARVTKTDVRQRHRCRCRRKNVVMVGLLRCESFCEEAVYDGSYWKDKKIVLYTYFNLLYTFLEAFKSIGLVGGIPGNFIILFLNFGGAHLLCFGWKCIKKGITSDLCWLRGFGFSAGNRKTTVVFRLWHVVVFNTALNFFLPNEPVEHCSLIYAIQVYQRNSVWQGFWCEAGYTTPGKGIRRCGWPKQWAVVRQ